MFPSMSAITDILPYLKPKQDDSATIAALNSNAIPPDDPNKVLPTLQPPAKIIPPTVQADVIKPQDVDLMPHQKQMADLVPSMPVRSQFHHKWYTNVLNAIAGGLAGAAGHPEIGVQLHDRPYNNAMQDWQNNVNAIAPIAKFEQDNANLGFRYGSVNTKNKLTADETNAKLLEDANKTNVGNELKSRAENRRMLSGDEKLALEKRKLDITEKYNNARIENLQKPTNRVLRTVDDVNAAIKEVQSKIPGMSDADALTYIETRIGAASSYNPTNAGIRTQVNEDVKNSPANVAAEVSRTAALEKAKLDAAETAKQEFVAPIIEQLNSLGDDPTKGIIRSESFGSLPKATQEIILRNPGFKIPNPISSKAPEQFAIGRAALNHVTSVEELLKDPEIKQNLGALSGRISLAKQFIGGDPYGGKDSNEWKAGNVDPIQIDMQGLDPNSKMARFLTDVSNLLNWEVKNIAGNRPAHQLFDRLQKNAPSVVAGEFTNLGRLQGVKDGIVNAMKGFAGITTSTEKKKSFSEMLEEVK